MVFATADVRARIDARAALANDDVAGHDGFAAELLHAEALGFRIATVARGAACFLMCHLYFFFVLAAAFGAAFFAGALAGAASFVDLAFAAGALAAGFSAFAAAGLAVLAAGAAFSTFGAGAAS